MHEIPIVLTQVSWDNYWFWFFRNSPTVPLTGGFTGGFVGVSVMNGILSTQQIRRGTHQKIQACVVLIKATIRMSRLINFIFSRGSELNNERTFIWRKLFSPQQHASLEDYIFWNIWFAGEGHHASLVMAHQYVWSCPFSDMITNSLSTIIRNFGDAGSTFHCLDQP